MFCRQQFLNPLGTDSGLPLSAAGAVNVSGGETRVGGRELDINRGELGRLPRPAKGRGAAAFLVLLLRRAAADLQRRPYRPRRYAVDADSLWSELLRERFHIIHRRGLGLSIVV